MTKLKVAQLLFEIKLLSENYSEDLELGRVATLQNFEIMVKQVCDLLASLPPVEAKDFETDLIEILRRISEWSNKLKNRQENLRSSINDLSEKIKAHDAYSKVIKHQNDN